MVIKHTSHARYDIWYHVAFSTKYRKEIWTKPETRNRVSELFRAIARQYDMEIDTMECLPDHVHFTLSAPPRLAPARAIQIIKSVSTKKLLKEYKWLRQYYWGGEIWVAGYFIRTVGPNLTKEQIDSYITEQAEEV